MELIVGLGNPGREYTLSRHNIGFLVIDRLAHAHGIALKERKHKSRWGTGEVSGQRVLLAKPHTYMNLSGEAVKLFFKAFALASHQLIVIHDDLDLSFGRIKIKEKGGNGGHKGIQSIMSCVGGGNFTRVRIGIGRPFEGIEATEYVVQPFDESQRYALDEVMVRARAALETLLRSGIHAAMNQCNRKK